MQLFLNSGDEHAHEIWVIESVLFVVNFSFEFMATILMSRVNRNKIVVKKVVKEKVIRKIGSLSKVLNQSWLVKKNSGLLDIRKWAKAIKVRLFEVTRLGTAYKCILLSFISIASASSIDYGG